MVRPIRVVCVREVAISGPELGAQILDVDRWRSFRGYGPIPGIRSARFRARTEAVVGSEIEVESQDGSRHVEQIVAWDPARAIAMRFIELSPPLVSLASHFIERWEFTPTPDGRTRVQRTMELHPTGPLGWLALTLVSPFMRRALARHLADIDPPP